jgi:hypothetical protein
MQKKLIVAAILGVTGSFSAAQAADPTQARPEARAQMQIQFGGSQVLAQRMNFRFLVDHDRRAVDASVPALFQMDFTADGLGSARFNGVPFAQRQLAAQQAEGETAFTVFDWTLLAIGAAGIGVVVADIADHEETKAPVGATSGGGSGGDGGGDSGGGILPDLGLFTSHPASHGLDAEYRAWLDNGTGQMGDLF